MVALRHGFCSHAGEQLLRIRLALHGVAAKRLSRLRQRVPRSATSKAEAVADDGHDVAGTRQQLATESGAYAETRRSSRSRIAAVT